MFKKDQIIKVKLTDLAEKNLCYGKLDNGMSVFVNGLVTIGDIVNAKIIKIKKNYLICKFESFITKSSSRVDPKCEYFGLCGGCKWQHVDYSKQLIYKKKLIENSIKQIGGFKNLYCEDCISSEKKFYYRNKVDFSFTDLRYLSEEELNLDPNNINKRVDFALGFHPSGCYSKAIDIEKCHLISSISNQIQNVMRSFCITHKNKLPIYSTRSHKGELRNLVIREGFNSGQIMINLVTSTHNSKLMQKLSKELISKFNNQITTFVNSTTNAKNTIAFGQKEYCMIGDGFIIDILHNYKFRISPNSFFQTNTHQAEKLFEEMIALSELDKDQIVYDLCCGTGAISILASNHCKKVLGIEINEHSIKDAKINAKLNNISNCEFLHLNINNLSNIKEITNQFGKPNVIIIDPPRAGLSTKSIQNILKLKPEKIIYISCNPSSFARDAKIICEHYYDLNLCKPIDLFPQTNHVELISKFIIK